MLFPDQLADLIRGADALEQAMPSVRLGADVAPPKSPSRAGLADSSLSAGEGAAAAEPVGAANGRSPAKLVGQAFTSAPSRTTSSSAAVPTNPASPSLAAAASPRSIQSIYAPGQIAAPTPTSKAVLTCRIGTAASALSVIALRLLADAPTLCSDSSGVHFTLFDDHGMLISPNIYISAAEPEAGAGLESLRALTAGTNLTLRINISPADAWYRRPLRFGLTTMSSTLGLQGLEPSGGAPAADFPPALPAFSVGQINTALPLTVCYGLDQVQHLTEDCKTLTSCSTPTCHEKYVPPGDWPAPPLAPGNAADADSLVSVALDDFAVVDVAEAASLHYDSLYVREWAAQASLLRNERRKLEAELGPANPNMEIMGR